MDMESQEERKRIFVWPSWLKFNCYYKGLKSLALYKYTVDIKA